jgi:hypothetical protein
MESFADNSTPCTKAAIEAESITNRPVKSCGKSSSGTEEWMSG